MLALLAALVASPAPADPLAGIRGLRIVTYDVSGDDWDAIGRSIATRAMGVSGGLEVAAKTSWQVRWQASSMMQGHKCRVVGATVAYSITVILPRLANEKRLDPELRQRWRTYLGQLRTHEAGHARYAYDHVGDIRNAVMAGDCAHIRRNGQVAVNRINRWQDRYDRLTHHGEAQSKAPPVG